MKKTKILLSGILLFNLLSSTSIVNALSVDKTTKSSVVFVPGSLTLDTEPADFIFPNIKLSNAVSKTILGNTGKVYPLAITDLRGTEVGYKLTVQASIMTAVTGEKLKGNNIGITVPTPTTTAINTQMPVKPSGPIFADAQDINGVPIPTTVMTANQGTKQGLNTWAINFKDSDISLNILPGEALAKPYSTDIIWTLIDSST